MPSTFVCRHCGNEGRKNPRNKGRQNYCGGTSCQQARKNAWERAKLKHEPGYKAKRTSCKKRWYETDRQGAAYQAHYRKAHPDYVEQNRKKQLIRNQRVRNDRGSTKIVKTDALASQSVEVQGLYVLIPYGKRKEVEKIVKTDALLVQLVDTVTGRRHQVPP
jgi:hypothetical protein